MAAEINYDTVEDSQGEQFGPSAFRFIRSGTILGVPTAAGDTAEDFLYKIIRLLPTYGTPHPTRPDSFLSRISTYGATVDGARFRLLYEPFGSSVSSALLVTTSATPGTLVTDRIPGTGAMLKVSLDTEAETDLIPEAYLQVAISRSQPTVSVFKLVQGSLSETAQMAALDFIDKVNEGVWMGRKTGGWRCVQNATTVSKYGGYYTQNTVGLAKGRKNEVWDEIGVLRSGQTGKYAANPTTIAAIAADAMRDYKFGIITTPDVGAFTNPDYGYIPAQYKKGYIRAGMYETTNFATLFGFGDGSNPFGINKPDPSSKGPNV